MAQLTSCTRRIAKHGLARAQRQFFNQYTALLEQGGSLPGPLVVKYLYDEARAIQLGVPRACDPVTA